MKLKINKIYFISRNCLFGILAVFIAFTSCSGPVSFEEYVKKELAREIRNDSLIYGIHFGMKNVEFRDYCTDMNRKKIFFPNPSGSAVRLNMENGFESPVNFDFFPDFDSCGGINKLNATLNYRDFSYYDESYAIENLIIEAKRNFEEGYGGNKFLELPHEDKILKYRYVKIDGNRKIVLSPSFDGQKLHIAFEDLNPDY